MARGIIAGGAGGIRLSGKINSEDADARCMIWTCSDEVRRISLRGLINQTYIT